MKAIIGEKLGMTQIFDDEGRAVPVTVIQAGPCHVIQIKTRATDGYDAVQLSFQELSPSRVNQPMAGHFGKAGVPPCRHLVELRVEDPGAYEVGQEIAISDVLAPVSKADVTGLSKGKGFQGVMKRHNFSGQGASHGVHKVHRAPGSIGACATPSRVFRGKRLPGRMGGDRTTMLNLGVVAIDDERGLLLLRGAVPGRRGSIVVVREAVKARV